MNKYTIRLFNQFFSPLLYTLPNWTWSAFFFCNRSWLQITIESFLAMPPSSNNKRNFIPVTVYLRRAGGFTEYGQMLCSGPPPVEQPQRVTFRGVQKWKAFFISLAVLVIRAWDEYILNSLTRMLSLVFLVYHKGNISAICAGEINRLGTLLELTGLATAPQIQAQYI